MRHWKVQIHFLFLIFELGIQASNGVKTVKEEKSEKRDHSEMEIHTLIVWPCWGRESDFYVHAKSWATKSPKFAEALSTEPVAYCLLAGVPYSFSSCGAQCAVLWLARWVRELSVRAQPSAPTHAPRDERCGNGSAPWCTLRRPVGERPTH